MNETNQIKPEARMDPKDKLLKFKHMLSTNFNRTMENIDNK